MKDNFFRVEQDAFHSQIRYAMFYLRKETTAYSFLLVIGSDTKLVDVIFHTFQPRLAHPDTKGY